MKNLCLIALSALLAISCNQGTQTATEPEAAVTETSIDPALMEKANELSQKLIIVDTHVDLPYRLENHYEDIDTRTETGDMDYERSRKGGLDAPFMSIYTPARLQETGGSYDLANTLIDSVEKIAEKWPDKFAIAKSVDDVKAIKAQNKIALPLGLENGAPVEGNLENLQHFYDRGIRYITLTHSEDNEICDSSYAETRTWKGLSEFGRKVVAEMNRLGIMVDISHVSDDAFWQVMEMTDVPAIASHSSCRKFTPGFERNMSDEMIVKLAEKGGVIMINFGSSFINDDYRKAGEKLREQLTIYMEEHQLERDDPKVREYRAQLRKDIPFADISDVVAHIDHVVKLVGIDYVGLGSDYDGVGDSLPTGLKDVSQYPNLVYELLKKGYSEEDIEKICSGNIFRVWSRVEAHAAAQAQAGTNG